MQDNYKVAKVTYFQDKQISAEETTDVKQMHNHLKDYLLEKFGAMRKPLEDKFGKMPDDSVNFSFWLSSVMPLSTQVRFFLVKSHFSLHFSGQNGCARHGKCCRSTTVS